MEQLSLFEYQDIKNKIKTKLNETVNNFVIIGFYLKQVRDNMLYTQDGYKNMEEFARGEFNISASTASRFMDINTRFSEDGNSQILKLEYANFGYSKLQEMLTVKDEDLGLITEDTTVKQIRELKKLNIEYEIIPGVSSLFGTASALEAELTIPEVSQSVIITRPAGRTPKKELESIKSFSKHKATMCIFLGISMIDKVVDELLEGYSEDTPVAVVKKATWPDQEIIRGSLKDIASKVKEANITKTAMIVVGDVLEPGDFTPSKLYDANFKHEYR